MRDEQNRYNGKTLQFLISRRKYYLSSLQDSVFVENRHTLSFAWWRIGPASDNRTGRRCPLASSTWHHSHAWIL